MIALALILCAAIATTGVLTIVKPALVHDWTRLLADKAGMWIAAAIRAVLGLGLFAAASESKAPMFLSLNARRNLPQKREHGTCSERFHASCDRLHPPGTETRIGTDSDNQLGFRFS